MFTGIIEKIGKVSHVTEKNISQVISIRIDDFNSALGDSICINGVCLTVEDIDDNVYTFSISPETYNLSNFKNIKMNDDVNIEKSLTINKLLSGHIVQGHVDTCSEITELKKIDNSWYVKIKIDSTYMKYIIQKGSITIDGVSLTINEVYTDEFSVMVIPHTYSNTIFKNYKVGSILNTEIDILAKYIEKLGNKE
jgi:riboflavin synthase